MSENLDKVTDTFKECIQLVASMTSNKWFYTSTSKLNEMNDNCIELSLGLQDCVIKCKYETEWKDQRECWKKCIKE